MADFGALTVKKRRAIVSLLSEDTVELAAQSAGISRRSLHRWMGESAFVAALRVAEDRALDAAVRRLLALSGAALGLLGEVLADDELAPGVRVRASGLILENLLRIRSLRDVEERLSVLEARLKDET